MRAFSGLLLAFLVLPAAAETFRLRAPAEALEAVIRAEDTLTLEVRYRGKTVVRTPALGLEIDGHLRAGSLPRLSGSARRTVNETIRPVVPEKRAVIPDRYNELRLSFGPKLAVTFRAYDDGVAYRFETAIDGEVIVRNENAGLRLAKDDTTWIALVNCRTEPGVDCFQSSHEENYQQLTVDAVPDARLAYLPITVQTAGGYVGFTESDLRDYPGLWLRRVPGEPALAGDFARYPLEEQVFGGEFKPIAGHKARRLPRTHVRHAHIPVARADGVAGCCRLVRQRSGLPAGQSVGAAGCQLDPTRPVHRGVDHQPPAVRRRFQVRAQHRDLPLLHRLRRRIRRGIHDVRCRLVGRRATTRGSIPISMCPA